METTDGEQSLFYAESIRVLEPIPKPKALLAIPAGTIIGPITEVHVEKILDEYGLEVAIPSICKLLDTTYVVRNSQSQRRSQIQ